MKRKQVKEIIGERRGQPKKVSVAQATLTLDTQVYDTLPKKSSGTQGPLDLDKGKEQINFRTQVRKMIRVMKQGK